MSRKDDEPSLTRRQFLKLSMVAVVGAALESCGQAMTATPSATEIATQVAELYRGKVFFDQYEYLRVDDVPGYRPVDDPKGRVAWLQEAHIVLSGGDVRNRPVVAVETLLDNSKNPDNAISTMVGWVPKGKTEDGGLKVTAYKLGLDSDDLNRVGFLLGPDGNAQVWATAVIRGGRREDMVVHLPDGEVRPEWEQGVGDFLARDPGVQVAFGAVPTATSTPEQPKPTATEVQRVFTAEQVQAATDAELLTAAGSAVPEVIKDRVDYAGIDLEASGVFRGGVGREYQYDFVLLSDKKTGLIGGVYQLETGRVLHAYGGEYSRGVNGQETNKTVLFVTDESFVDREEGKKQSFVLQGDDLNKSLQAAIGFEVARRAVSFTWNDPKGKEIFRDYLANVSVSSAWETSPSAADAAVAKLSSEEKRELLGDSIDFFVANSDKSIVTVYARVEGKSWGEGSVGYNGGMLAVDDKAINTSAYVCNVPDGKPNIPMYKQYGGLPPGGLASACVLSQGSELGRLDWQGVGQEPGFLLTLLGIYYGEDGANLWVFRDKQPPVTLVSVEESD